MLAGFALGVPLATDPAAVGCPARGRQGVAEGKVILAAQYRTAAVIDHAHRTQMVCYHEYSTYSIVLFSNNQAFLISIAKRDTNIKVIIEIASNNLYHAY